MKKTVLSLVLVCAGLFTFSAAEAGCWTHFNGWGQRVTNCGPGPGYWYGPGYYHGPYYGGRPYYWGGPRYWGPPAPGFSAHYWGPGWGVGGRWY